MKFDLNAPEGLIKAYGILAYLDLVERERVLNLPKKQRDDAVARIKKEVKEQQRRLLK